MPTLQCRPGLSDDLVLHQANLPALQGMSVPITQPRTLATALQCSLECDPVLLPSQKPSPEQGVGAHLTSSNPTHCTAELAWKMVLHGRQQEVIRLAAAMLQQGWRGAACSVSQSACLAGVHAQEFGLVACAGKRWPPAPAACQLLLVHREQRLLPS